MTTPPESSFAAQLRQYHRATVALLAAATLGAYLRARQVLLGLDNCERLPAAAGVVAKVLAGTAHLQILTTSRTLWRLRGEPGWRRLSLPGGGR
jgi:predicted ATPase